MKQETVDRLYQQTEYENNRTEPPEGFPALPDLPAGRYSTDEFYKLETEHLWPNAWLYGCHMDDLPEPGSYFLWDRIATTPIIITRAKDGEIRAFHNVCRHHGAALVDPKKPKGLAARLTCGYHGWTFGLDGSLIGIPDKRDFVDLDPSCRGLLQIKAEKLGKLIFINQNVDAPSLIESLGPMHEDLLDYDWGNSRVVESRQFHLGCNWKLGVENFLEAYHLPVIHQATVDASFNYKGATNTLFPGGQSRMAMPVPEIDPGDMSYPRNSMKDIPTASDFARKNIVTYTLFPNTFAPLTSTALVFLMLFPIDKDNARFDVMWFGPDWGEGERPEGWTMAIDHLDRTLAEDLEALQLYTATRESPAFKDLGVVLNYQERKIYNLHEGIDEAIGIDKIPEHLRVEPVLSKYHEDE